MKIDNIIIIGAMKCGTTSLHFILRQHPSIIAGSKKELNYFKDNNDINRYMEQFDIAPSQHRYTLESSPAYTKHRTFDTAIEYEIPYRISKLPSNVKIIYTMRNPIDRCESHVAHNIEHERFTRESFRLSHPIRTSLYASQLDIYRKYFASEQIFLLSIDEFRINPNPILRDLERFLDIDQNSLYAGKPRKVRTLPGSFLNDDHKCKIANGVYSDMRRLVEEYQFSSAREWVSSLERWL